MEHLHHARIIEVAVDQGASQSVTFDNCIIATGATAKLLPGTSKSANVLTYEEMILTERLPASIIIGGSGAIGTEFAYVLANYGDGAANCSISSQKESSKKKQPMLMESSAKIGRAHV